MLRQGATEIVPDILNETLFDPDLVEDAKLRDHAGRVIDRLDDIRKAVDALALQADEVLAEWRITKDESAWKKSVEASAQAYQELRDNLARKGLVILRIMENLCSADRPLSSA